jgi:hypothetical protein
MSFFPQQYTIGRAGGLTKMDTAEFDNDPRGIVWIFEPPNRGATYVLGCDPTTGRTGWNRYSRVKEDFHTDNGAIEVIKVGKDGAKDVQVAEYAAPIDAFDIAYVINILGRMYAGTDDDQCKAIIEVFPGPGAGTLQQCLELGYTNHFKWEYYGDTPAQPTRAMGWHASNRTNRDLWVKASRHLVLQNCIIRSPWLTEEYADCRMSVDKDYGENPGGHDDRVRAFNLALWAANSWSMNIERTTEKVATSEAVDWQHSDMAIEEIYEGWNDMFDRIG